MLQVPSSGATWPSALPTWILILCIAGNVGRAAAQEGGRTAYVVNSMQQDNPANNTFRTLRAALECQQFDTILLTHAVRIFPELWPPERPLLIGRNVTLATANFSQAAGNFAHLHLAFMEARAVILRNVTVTIKNIALLRARKNSGQGIPFFAGEGTSSVLLLENVLRVRLACAPNEEELVAALRETPRAPSGGGVTDLARNQVDLDTYNYNGTEYPGSVRAIDVSSVVSPGDVADTQEYYAGYALEQINTTRICLSYVPSSCVEAKGADVCVIEAGNALLAAEAAAKQQGAGGPNVAAIAAPVAVGVALLAAAVAAAVVYKKRKQWRAAAVAAELAAAAKPAKDGGQLPPAPPTTSSKEHHDGSHPSSIIGAHGGAAGTMESLAVGGRGGGWQLLACHTCPEFRDATPNDKIKLGVLLGAGSFGRVYRGVWRDMCVAVKVLQHDSTTAAAISNEVDLVMSFRHPNIVAAYHFVTWSQSDSNEAALAKQPQQYGQPSTSNRSLSSTPVSRHPSIDDQQSTGNRSKLKTVTECSAARSSSGRLSFPRPPGVVVAGSTAGSTIGSLSRASTGLRQQGSSGSTDVPQGSSRQLVHQVPGHSPLMDTAARVSQTPQQQQHLSNSSSGGRASAAAPEPASAFAPAPAAEYDMPKTTAAAAAAGNGGRRADARAARDTAASSSSSSSRCVANVAGDAGNLEGANTMRKSPDSAAAAAAAPPGKAAALPPAAQQQFCLSAPAPASAAAAAAGASRAAGAAAAQDRGAGVLSLSDSEAGLELAAALPSGSHGLRPIRTSISSATHLAASSAAGGSSAAAAAWSGANSSSARLQGGAAVSASSMAGYAAGAAGGAAGMLGVTGLTLPAAANAAADGGVDRVGGNSGVQLIPFSSAQLQEQQQQQQRQQLGSSSGTEQQQQQQGSDHVVIVRPGFVQLQQPPQDAATAGSGWRAVGDDLEMDEFGNMYTTGGNAAPRQDDSTFSNSSVGAGRRQVHGTARANKATEAQTWLILEFCDGGTLLDLLTDGRLESSRPGGGRKMALALTLLRDIASGMNYLHSRSVIHGDLKPGNVLIKHEQGAPYGRVAKVSDFGLSRALQVGQSHKSTRTMGTMNHTPPELLRLGRLSPAGDVYAFGILMWEVFTSKIAFSGLHYGEVFEQVALWQKRPPIPSEMPAEYAELMIACWAADPFSRPSFSAVQQQLHEQLTRVVQDTREAQERFISDL